MSGPRNIDQRTEELLNGGIDDELSAAEREELSGVLAASSDAREANEELKSLARLMKDLPELEPPQHLQESIERQIRLPVESKAAGGKPGFFGNWLSANWLRTGFALAAGVVLTVTVYEMGSGPMTDQDAANLVGTVVKNQVPGQGDLVDQARISNDALNGLVELRQADDLFTLDVQLNSDGPAEVVVNFAEQQLTFEGITRIQDQDEAVTVANGSINVTSSGEQRYALKLRRIAEAPDQQTANLGLEFFVNNSLVHEAELSVSLQ